MKTLKILLGGTSSDSRLERDSAERAIQSLRIDSAHLEIRFSDEKLVEVALNLERECDIYIGLYDRTQFGRTAQTEGISLAELELKEAQQRGKSILIFIKQRMELEIEDSRQKEFLDKALELDGVKYCEPEFASPVQLETQIANALMDLLSERFHLHARRPPFHAPNELRTFVGRELQLEELTDALSRGETVLVHGLSDFGGLGKTELAIRAAHLLRDVFPDGILWANVPTVRPADTLAIWASEYGGFAPLGRGDLRFEFRPISPETRKIEETATRVSAFQDLLRGKRMLAILDGVIDQHDHEKIVPLLQALKGSAVIVTSRVGQLPVLADARRIALDRMNEDEARNLFTSVVGELPSDRERALISKIGQVLDWTPLPLHLAAVQLREQPELSLPGLLVMLQTQRDSLETRNWGYSGARVNQAAVSFCNELLSRDEARFFHLLGAFAGDDFDNNAAAFVTETAPDLAGKRLDRLVKRSLVQERQRIGRYHLHPVLKSFAREKLVEGFATSEEERRMVLEAEMRMATYYCAVARENGRKLQGAEIHSAVTILDTELSNIFAGQKWAQARNDRVGWELCRDYISGATTYYFSLKSMWSDWIAWSNAGIEACSKLGDQRGGSAIAGSLGMLHFRKGEMDQANEFYKHALESMEKSGNLHGMAAIYMNLGNLQTEKKEWNRALESHVKSLRLRERLGDQHGVAQSRANLGTLYAKHGEKEKARANWIQALEIFDSLKLVQEADIVRKWLKQLPPGR